MGIELASAFIRVRADGSKLTGDFGGIQQAANRALQGIASTAAGIGQSVYQGVSGALQGVSGPMAAVTGQLAKSWDLLKSGIEQAGVFEKQTVKMETMMGSAEATKKVMDDLTKFAVETPFEMPGIVQVATQMIQVGDRGDDLMKTLKMLGDASGGSAAEFQLMGTVFNQVRGAGALFTQDFRQLSSRGIISLNDLAKHFNVSAAEADKMMTTGKIKFPEFKKMLMGLTAEGGRYHDMAKKQAQTIEGLNSTLKDAVNITLRLLVTPLVPFVKGLTNAYISLANAANDFVTQGGTIVSFAIAGGSAFAVMGKAIATTTFLMRLFGVTVRQALIGTGIGLALVALGAAFGALVGFIEQSTAVSGYFGDAWAGITESFMDFGFEISRYFSNRLGEWAETKKLFQEVAEQMGISISRFVDNTVDMFNRMFGTAETGLLGLFNNVMTFVHDTMDFLSLMATNWDKMWLVIKINTTIVLFELAQYAAIALNAIASTAIGVGAAIWSIMRDTGSNIMLLFSALSGFINGVWAGMGEGIKGIARTMVDLFAAAVRGVMGMFKGLWEGIKNKAFGQGDFTTGFAKAFSEEMNKVGDKTVFDNLSKTAENAAAAFNSKIAGIEGEGAGLGKMAENAGQAFSKASSQIILPTDPFQAEIEALRQAGAEITQETIEERRKNREAEAAWDRALAPRKKKEKEEEAKAGENAKARFSLETGRYSFTGIADKIQDKLLGKGKDHGAEQVELAKAGLTIQKEHLQVSKDKKNAPGILANDNK